MPVQVHQIFPGKRVEVVCPDLTGEKDGRLDLLEVLPAVRALSEMLLETAVVGDWERAIEVRGDQPDRLLTGQVTGG